MYLDCCFSGLWANELKKFVEEVGFNEEIGEIGIGYSSKADQKSWCNEKGGFFT